MSQKMAFTLLAVLCLTSCGSPVQLAPDAILPDGGVYQGEIKDGLFHGKGSLKYSDGSYYTGQFKEGVFHGEGKQVLVDGTLYEGTFFEGNLTGQFVVKSPEEKLHYHYEGELLDGLLHGQGKLTYNDGNIYEGEFKNGKYDGDGEFKGEDDSHYKGKFKDGYYHGIGKLIYSNGTTFEGEFKEGRYHGKGVFKDSNDGSHYEGEFKGDYYDGFGKLTYKNGAIYEGQFRKGAFEGKGRYSLDNSWYEGVFSDDQLSGKAEYVDSQGNRYKGETSDWQANGKGKLVQVDGTILQGTFEYGALTGIGEKIKPDGSHYKGNFQYNEYDGVGTLNAADGSIYEGEFSYGRYHGEGKLSTRDSETGKKQVLEGRWSYGQLAFNTATGERQHEEAELALENHQSLLSESLSKIIDGDSRTNAYFLGIAGDGSQSVFRREMEFISNQVEKRYSTQGRSVLLINHHTSAKLYPMATRRSIASAITSIGEKMDNDDDILFMYLTSHGSKSHDLYLNHDSIRLPDISSKELKKILTDAQVKWKVIMVSACYSGGFIAELQDEHTLVMTASDSKSTSFGCSEESEMTYFGKALFKEVLSKNNGIKLDDAFSQAKEIILGWEKDQGLEPSNPMISAPKAIVEKLAGLTNVKTIK